MHIHKTVSHKLEAYYKENEIFKRWLGKDCSGSRLCLLTFSKLLNSYQWKSVKGEPIWAQMSHI